MASGRLLLFGSCWVFCVSGWLCWFRFLLLLSLFLLFFWSTFNKLLILFTVRQSSLSCFRFLSFSSCYDSSSFSRGRFSLCRYCRWFEESLQVIWYTFGWHCTVPQKFLPSSSLAASKKQSRTFLRHVQWLHNGAQGSRETSLPTVWMVNSSSVTFGRWTFKVCNKCTLPYHISIHTFKATFLTSPFSSPKDCFEMVFVDTYHNVKHAPVVTFPHCKVHLLGQCQKRLHQNCCHFAPWPALHNQPDLKNNT